MRIPQAAPLEEVWGLLGKRQDAPPSSSTTTPTSSPTASSTSLPTPTPPPDDGGSTQARTAGIVRSSYYLVCFPIHLVHRLTPVQVLAIFGVFVILNTLIFIYLRRLRRRNASPQYMPGEWLKDRWRRWSPKKSSKSRGSYSPSLQRSENSELAATPRPQPTGSTAPSSTRNGASNRNSQMSTTSANNASVTRNTSTRSTITLPAYTAQLRPNEELLGREGERAGIDTIVDFPETIDEEEARREDEMESLYQIRLQRRRENAAREERRRLRREARARGDTEEVERLRRESRLGVGGMGTAAQMIVEHQSRGRDRRVSSVSYAGAGVARHDGTRIRANSAESDSNPLLGEAASMGSSRTLHAHHRDRSENSFMSASTMSEGGPGVGASASSLRRGSDDLESLALTQTRTRSDSHAPSTLHTVDTQDSTTSSAVSLHPNSTHPDHDQDLGDSRIPLVDPPDYDGPDFDYDAWGDAPPYSSPLDQRRSQRLSRLLEAQQQQRWSRVLPQIEHLPAIEVTTSSPHERTPAERDPFEQAVAPTSAPAAAATVEGPEEERVETEVVRHGIQDAERLRDQAEGHR
jgi:hypothetical protein